MSCVRPVNSSIPDFKILRWALKIEMIPVHTEVCQAGARAHLHAEGLSVCSFSSEQLNTVPITTTAAGQAGRQAGADGLVLLYSLAFTL